MIEASIVAELEVGLADSTVASVPAAVCRHRKIPASGATRERRTRACTNLLESHRKVREDEGHPRGCRADLRLRDADQSVQVDWPVLRAESVAVRAAADGAKRCEADFREAELAELGEEHGQIEIVPCDSDSRRNLRFARLNEEGADVFPQSSKAAAPTSARTLPVMSTLSTVYTYRDRKPVRADEFEVSRVQ
ncbi:hypothetical protein U0023_23645 (plasmid) [Microvirga lotononidis]|nr:hypothetical protein [Microvirga lotononidis]WQO30452.1 hypothetical protein U0023_23645 [Microvirga lotononidis]